MRLDRNISNRLIYLDYQASTPVDPRVVSAMAVYNTECFGNPHSADHILGWRSSEAIEIAAERVAFVINADSDEIIFTSGATEANNLAILGLAGRAPKARRRILVSAIDHKSVLEAAYAAERRGFEVDVLSVDREGKLDLAAFDRRLAEDVLLVSVVAVNNEIGTVQPIAEIGRRCRQAGAFFHCDAVHSLTAGPITVGALDVDLISLSSHKIYGPKGVGALYVRRNVQRHVEPLLYGGGQQNGLRAGTLPVPLCVGFGLAATLMVGKDAEAERRRISELRDLLIRKLRDVAPWVRLNGPIDSRHPGNANLSFAPLSAHDILAALQSRVAASTGSACMSGREEPSHVLRAIGLSGEEAQGSIRFSVGRFSTEDDIRQAAEFIEDAVCRLSVDE